MAGSWAAGRTAAEPSFHWRGDFTVAVEARREGIGPRGDRTTSGFVASPQPGSAVAFRRRGISRRKWDAAGVSGGRGRGRGCLGTCGSHRGCPVRGDSGPQRRARRLLQSPAPGSARARPRVCTGCRLLPHTFPIAFKGLALVALAVVTGQLRKGVLRPPALRARGTSPGRSSSARTHASRARRAVWTRPAPRAWE